MKIPSPKKESQKFVTDAQHDVIVKLFQGNVDEPFIVKWCKQRKNNMCYNERIIAISKYRVITLKSTMCGIQVSKNLHFLDLKSLHVEENDSKKILLTMTFLNGTKLCFDAAFHAEDYARCIQRCLHKICCAFPRQAQPLIHLDSTLHWDEYFEQTDPFEAFCNSYRAYCDYFIIPVRSSVLEYLHTTCRSNKNACIDFQKCFQHCADHVPDYKDARALIGALKNCSLFSSIIVEDIVLRDEDTRTLFDILQYNFQIRGLIIINGRLTSESFQSLKQAGMTQSNAINKTSPFPGLQKLDLSRNPMNKETIYSLSESLKSFKRGIKILSLSQCKISNHSISHMLSCIRTPNWTSSLQELNLSGNTLAKEGSIALAELISCSFALTKLELAQASLDTSIVCNALHSNFVLHRSLLKSLNLSFNCLTASAGEHLGKIMLDTKSLSQLMLKGTSISKQSLHHIISSVVRNGSENVSFSIDLSNNDLKGSRAIEIAKLIETYPGAHLERLVFNNCSLNDNSLSIILNAIKQCNNIKILSIENNPTKQRYYPTYNVYNVIRNTGAALSQIIDQRKVISPPLQELYMSSNKTPFSLKIILPMIQALENNKTLRVLDLRGNNGELVLAKALARMLINNCTIQALFWDNNKTPLQGFLAFKNGLQANRSLIMLPVPINDTRKLLEGKDPPREDLFSVFGEIYKLVERNQRSHDNSSMNILTLRGMNNLSMKSFECATGDYEALDQFAYSQERKSSFSFDNYHTMPPDLLNKMIPWNARARDC